MIYIANDISYMDPNYTLIFYEKGIAIEEIFHLGFPTLVIFKFVPILNKLLALIEIPNYKNENELVDFALSLIYELELEDEENPLYKKFPFQVSTFLFYLYKEEDWYSLEIKNIDNELVLRIFFFTGFFTEEWLNKLINFYQ
ncbi:MAG: hypothetical protein QW350_04095 [Candidatus Aenigmatarchaeota archaeon]